LEKTHAPPSVPPSLPPLPLVLSLDISIEQAGFLFTIHTLAYLFSSFVAAHIAFRVGEWRAILTGTLVFSTGLLLLGPIPYIHFRTGGKTGERGVIGVMATTLAVLGLSEAFVFLPFVPLVHAHFQGKLGWSEEEAEDLVSSVWVRILPSLPPSLPPSLSLVSSITSHPSLPLSLPPSLHFD